MIHVPLWVIRLILFILLAQLFPFLEICEIWILVDMILRRIARGRGVPLPQNPWGIDDDDDDDGIDIDYFREDIMILLENLQQLRSCACPKKAIRTYCDGTVFVDYVDDIVAVLEEYGRLAEATSRSTSGSEILRHTSFARCTKNVAVVFGECSGNIELINEFVPNNFNVMLRGATTAVLRHTENKISAKDLWKKHVVVVAATTKCTPFKLQVRTIKREMIAQMKTLLLRTRTTNHARTQIPKLNETTPLRTWLRDVNQCISNIHEQHHKDVGNCTASSSTKIAESSQRLLNTIQSIEKSGRTVRCIYAVGTTVAKKIVSNTDFGSRDIKVVTSRHPTFGLYSATDAFDARAGTFVCFLQDLKTLHEIHHLNDCYMRKHYQVRSIWRNLKVWMTLSPTWSSLSKLQYKASALHL